jgi:PBSX family phage portal protein
VSWAGLAKSLRAGTHHASALFFKRNVLASTFIPHPKLSRESFRRVALDFLTFGNAYIERQKSRLGTTLKYESAPAKYMRRKADLKTYVMTDGWQTKHEFETGSVFHLMEPDISQEVYGLPEYLGALHAAWLNESSTLFRRRYYENGSHAGFILYMTDPAQRQEDVDALRDALKNAKGPGNFRNLFMYAPSGKKDGLQLIPVSEVAAKDEFFNVKNVTRDDLLAAHRVPPQLLGIVPSNTGGFGAADTAARVFARNEIEPLQSQFLAFNVWANEVIRFNGYAISSD